MSTALVILFIALASIVIYILAGYPLLVGLLARRYGRVHLRKRPSEWPRVSILMAAHDEEAVIEAKLRSCLAQRYPSGRLEVIVVSDASRDATDAIAARVAREDSRVIALRRGERGGKNAALELAAARARGEILVFTDANALFRSDTVRELVKAFADPEVGCAIGELRLRGAKGAAASEGLYWRYEAFLKRCESALGSCLVGNGSLLAVRSTLCGPLDPDVANDFQQPMAVAHAGYRVVYEPRAVVEEDSAEGFREEMQRRVRIITRGLTGYFRLRHTLRGFRRLAFWSHKGLRWGTGYLLLGILASNVALLDQGTGWRLLLLLQGSCYLFALHGASRRLRGREVSRFGALCLYVCTLSAAGIMASLRALGGRRSIVWVKPASTRRVLEPVAVLPVPREEISAPPSSDSAPRPVPPRAIPRVPARGSAG